MLKKRLIAVIIVRDGQVVQSIRFKHTNVIHYDAIHAVETFSCWDVDELVLLNVSRKVETASRFREVLENASRYCFIPMAVGGWVRDEDYAAELLRSGADKLILNTALHEQPILVSRLSARYGAQCIVASIDVKRNSEGQPTVMVDRGRFDTGESPVAWAHHAEQLGVGEILFNSIDHDGARCGYDLDTLNKICDQIHIPVIAFGGVLEWRHFAEGIAAGADAVAAANIFHYVEHSTKKAKQFLDQAGISVRKEGSYDSSNINWIRGG